MDRELLRQRLMATFLAELEEHVDSLGRDLLALERSAADRQPALVASLFRSAHSLKGAARSVHVRPIEEACHALESLLDRARDGRTALDPAAVQLLLGATDALGDARARLRAGEDLSAGPLQALLPALQRAAAAPPGDAAPSRTASSAATPPAPMPPASAVQRGGLSDPRRPPPEGAARVAIEKLDRLLAAGGEFIVARRRMAAGQDAIAAMCDDVRRWREEWMRIEGPLRALIAASGGALPLRVASGFDQARERSARLEHRFDMLSAQLAADAHALDRAAARLEDEIRSIRMFPFQQACEGLARAVRDLSHAEGKQVRLVIDGGDLELGRFVLAHLRDALLHLVRNAVDHGIEPPAARLAAGKPAEATVRVSANLRGSAADVAVADDGRGLDLEAIRDSARRRGVPTTGDDREDARLVFVAGVTTAGHVTELSGRGVGLEVVRHHVESLHGHVDVTYQPGQGTRIAIAVPVSVATIRALLLGVGGQTFALPLVGVQQLARAGAGDVAVAGGREILLRESGPVPLVALADVLGVARAAPHHCGPRVPVVIASAGERQAALAVDELIGEDELLVKPLGARLGRVRHVTGATILPSGRVALVLNAAEIVATALARPASAAAAAGPHALRDHGPRRLLVADDSLTTRTLERSILEAAGYEVFVASDGREAWSLLQEQPVDLVVADVEMPRMDGIARGEAIRRSAPLRDLPVVLVTALESPHDRMRGLEAGANAYLPKSTFDQRTLLDTIADLL